MLADEEIIGSGPYMLSQYKAGEQAVLEANAGLRRRAHAAGAAGLRQVLQRPGAAQARRSRPVRSTSRGARSARPTSTTSRSGGDVDGRHGRGLRSSATGCGSSTTTSARTRPSARLPRRSSTATPSPRTPTTAPSTPAYSIVPPGFGGQKDSFQEKYGEPDADAAATAPRGRRHQDAGRASPWATRRPTTARTPWTRPTSSPTSSTPAACSRSTLESTEWEQYQTLYKEGAYDLFILGWFPDYPGRRQLPVAVHPSTVGSSPNGYSSHEVNSLLDQELGRPTTGSPRGAVRRSCRTSSPRTSR